MDKKVAKTSFELCLSETADCAEKRIVPFDGTLNFTTEKKDLIPGGFASLCEKKEFTENSRSLGITNRLQALNKLNSSNLF